MTDSELFTYIKHKSDYKEVGLDVDYKIQLNHEECAIEIYFEESDSDMDWKINLNFLPKKVRFFNRDYFVHRGFYKSYMSAREEILVDLEDMRKRYPFYNLNVYCWSYGTGVGNIFIVDVFNTLKIRINKFVGFGSVKVWYSKPDKYLKWICKDIKEYITPNDFVTWCVPFCHRINGVKVGDKFSFRKIFKTEYYHTNYDLFID